MYVYYSIMLAYSFLLQKQQVALSTLSLRSLSSFMRNITPLRYKPLRSSNKFYLIDLERDAGSELMFKFIGRSIGLLSCFCFVKWKQDIGKVESYPCFYQTFLGVFFNKLPSIRENFRCLHVTGIHSVSTIHKLYCHENSISH